MAIAIIFWRRTYDEDLWLIRYKASTMGRYLRFWAEVTIDS